MFVKIEQDDNKRIEEDNKKGKIENKNLRNLFRVNNILYSYHLDLYSNILCGNIPCLYIACHSKENVLIFVYFCTSHHNGIIFLQIQFNSDGF